MRVVVAFPVTGSPALTLPVGIDETAGVPVPVVFNALPFTEDKLLAIGAALEAAIDRDFRPPLSGGVLLEGPGGPGKPG